MKEPIFHPKTKQSLEGVMKRQFHATLIAGPDGAGKAHLAQYLASKLLNIDDNLSRYPYFIHIKPDKQSINIDSVREIKSNSQLKTTGKDEIRRVILVEDAHYMGREAQNAFLKLLEEPPGDTCIIMTTDSKEKLLPTIRSRMTITNVTLPSKAQVTKYYDKKGHSADKIDKNFFISSGRVGLLDALLNEDSEHSLIGAINEAKSVLAMSTFERLVFVSNIDSKKFNVRQFLDGLITISKAGLETAIQKEDEQSTTRWLNINKLANEHAQDFDRSNPNMTLSMTDVVLNL